MLLKLLRDARITHKSGEIVEVSPAEAYFLISVGSAEPAGAARVETPEDVQRPTRGRPRRKAEN